MSPKLINCLPAWTKNFSPEIRPPIRAIEERVKFVIQLSQLNVEHNTGGPFGAAIFEKSSGNLVSIGLNLVVSTKCSLAHAEMVAIALAQEKLQTFDLGGPSLPDHELVTSCEPCAMCFGAIPWSGVKRVICGAQADDARSIGFDEGPKPENWVEELEKREIELIREICRKEAVKVLNGYKKKGGAIYNARQGGGNIKNIK